MIRGEMMLEIADKEERPPCDSAILKALFDTIPVIFPKEDASRWTGATKKYLREAGDHE